MNRSIAALTFASLALAAPAFAQDLGDAAAGEKVFKKCQTCHVVADADGNVLAGKGIQGPNLYGVVGRVAGSYPEFDKYGDGILELAAMGYVWTQEDLATYTKNPSKFLAETSGNKRARSNMAFKLTKDSEAADVAAYLVSLAPPADPAAEAPAVTN